VIVVVSHRYDDAARRLVAAWPTGDAVLLTAGDLSTSGWYLRSPDDARAKAVIGGVHIGAADIFGVLTCSPAILAHELTDIRSEDRDLVAAEMTSFLVCWLSALSCPMLNRPSCVGLWGPPWRPLHWLDAARRLGIPVEPMLQRVAPTGPMATSSEPTVRVTVIGDACVGDGMLASHARRLARAAGVEFLTVEFTASGDAGRFVSASLKPDIGDPRVVAAVMEFFSERGPR
jgi:hypothetical protein